MPKMARMDPRKSDLANIIHVAWRRYTDFFGEPPHGTLEQIRALVELMYLDGFFQGIGNEAICLDAIKNKKEL